MKESVFSALGDFDGLTVLDLYAGSGSLGLEALSRGAKKAIFVENARDAIVKLEQNIETTGLGDKSEVVWADVKATLERNPEDRIDLVFLDPPYNMSPASVRADLEALVMGGFLSDDGKIVVHRPAKENAPEPLGLKLMWDREYGQSRIVVFAHEDEDEESIGASSLSGVVRPSHQRAHRRDRTGGQAVRGRRRRDPRQPCEGTLVHGSRSAPRCSPMPSPTSRTSRSTSFNGLLVDFATERKLGVIVKGLRAVSDFEYELQMAQMNSALSPGLDTIFVTTMPSWAFLSSSLVKQVARYGGSVDGLVPPGVSKALKERFAR